MNHKVNNSTARGGGISVMRDRVPAADAEKCATDVLLENFRLPPSLNASVARSMLLVGTRGSGKTYYLRHCRHTHKGVALIGDLRFLLNSITQDIGGAGLAFDLISPSLEPLIRAKTAALLAAWIVDECRDRRIEAPSTVFDEILAGELRSCDNLHSKVGQIALHEFTRPGRLDAFVWFVRQLASQCCDHGEPLLILLDRAEDVPYPCLATLFCLFDQSNPFLTVIASRPGLLVPTSDALTTAMVPGDHYDILHLAASPYCSNWRDYAREILEAWVPNALRQFPSEQLDLVLNLSRDSLRTAMKLVFNAIDETSGTFSQTLFGDFLKVKQDVMLRAAQGHVRHLNQRVSDLLAEIRRGTTPFKLPILLELPLGRQRQLPFLSGLRDLTGDEKFVRLALRSGLFTTRHGDDWHPYAEIQQVEIPPIFIWREGDQWNDILAID